MGNPTALGHIVLRNPLAPVTDLVRDFDQYVVEHGDPTIFLGTDRNLHRHELYQKPGHVIVGVTAHANGFGEPDLFRAKRFGRSW
jgi:hypothetical protein